MFTDINQNFTAWKLPAGYTKKMSKKRIIIIICIILMVAAGITSVFLLGLFKKDRATSPTSEQQQKYYSMLTGDEVSQSESQTPILGVMIENSDQARPQTGLDSAGIVFEAVTEGGITRYLALYQEKQPEIVGPVRSVRAHFVDWLMGFNASVAHVGGSEEALNVIEDRHANTLNQFANPGPYYRDPNREPPHNMYARTVDLRALQQEKGYKTATFQSFPRSNDSPNPTPQATIVNVDFSIPFFAAEFRYDPVTNAYIRYLGGEPHIDTVTNQPISVKNVIVLKAQPKENGVVAIGSGEALLFKDGNVQQITWQYPSYNDRIKFVDAAGNEVQLNRGQTWICAIGTDRLVSYQ